MTTETPVAGGLLRVALVYDMDACRWPTGVTRHALAHLERLARRSDLRLSLVSGRITEPDGRAYWDSLGRLARRELPLRTRDALRFWRLVPWPPVERWTGAVDWVYSPAEQFLPARRARRAVTSHDVLQNVRYGPPHRRARLAWLFDKADLILSVSRFNTEQLLDLFPACAGRVASVPNGAEDLFFEQATEEERSTVRADLGLPPRMPYLLSVANFQPRKNLVRLVRASARLHEVAGGDLALVLLGAGSPDEARTLRAAVEAAGSRCVIRMPGYRQGPVLRAVYAEAKALVFPSLCESFGIPAVEAMAQGLPVALANSTALPEVAGEAGWYFDPENDDSMTAAVRSLLDQPAERARRSSLGRAMAAGYRWDRANEMLVKELINHG